MLKASMFILKNLGKILCSQAQYNFLCSRFINYIIQKQINIILSFTIPRNPISIFSNSFFYFKKILLYIFFIYIQYFILRRAYNMFLSFHHHYNLMIGFRQYSIINSTKSFILNCNVDDILNYVPSDTDQPL